MDFFLLAAGHTGNKIAVVMQSAACFALCCFLVCAGPCPCDRCRAYKALGAAADARQQAVKLYPQAVVVPCVEHSAVAERSCKAVPFNPIPLVAWYGKGATCNGNKNNEIKRIRGS